MYFDARTAKLLQPGEHLIIEGCQGLRLVASPKWKSWVYRYKDAAGKMRQVAFARWPEVPAAEAVSRWQALRDGRASGVDPAAEKRSVRAAASRPAQATTVRQVCENYTDDVLTGTRTPAALAQARRAFELLLEEDPALADSDPADVSRARAYDVLKARAGTPTMAAKLRSLLGAAWEHAQDSGRMSQDVPNWWRQLMRGRLKSKGKIVGGEHQGQTHAVLTLQECGQVLRWGHGRLPAHSFDVLVMYLWTGARGVEILRLRPEHVRIESGVMWATLPKALTKNAAVPRAVDQRIPLLGRARRVVQGRLDAVKHGEEMWPDAAGKPYTQTMFSTAVYDWMPDSVKGKRRGGTGWPVTGWSPHRLRATVRTLLAGMGCPHEVGEAIMGHLPPAVQGTYNRHTYDAERLVWLKKLADQLEAVAGLPRRP